MNNPNPTNHFEGDDVTDIDAEADIDPMDALEGNDPQDIAVVGMAGRFPDAETPDEFWQNLRDGHESVRTFTDDDLREAGVPDSLLADPNYVRSGTPLQDFTMFDADFFGLGPKDAAIMDPQHRQLLEVAWETLESAGHPPSGFDGDIGVFAGCGMSAYFIYNVLTNPDLVDQVGTFLLRHTGNDKDFLATRVSYALNLTGPSVSVQTACSTSLVAIHHAAQSLLQYECDMALAGGVTIEIPHGVGYLRGDGDPVSPEGHCRAFDHRSSGTVFGSGAGMVALRRLDDAVADGDLILGVIKGSGVNNDGANKVSYLAPSVDGQAAAISEAMAVADVDPETIQYIEAHGTGTPMGDPIEIAALNDAFGRANGPATIAIGSVKPNIGHLDTAAGVAGFIKLVQAVRHRELPPSINYEAPNPAVDFAGGPFYVNDQLREWPDTGSLPARGGINSLGVGGTNAHVIVEEPPVIERPTTPSPRRASLLLLSGRNAGAVEGNTARLEKHLADTDDDLDDIAWSLATTRHGFSHRRSVVATSIEDAVERLGSGDSNVLPARQQFAEHANLVWLFPGGGAQYPDMGRGLYDHEPVYTAWVDRGLDRMSEVHGLDLRSLLFPEDDTDESIEKLLTPADRQLAAIFITSFAMAKLQESWGYRPRAMAGHSLGQITAACYAGVMSFEDALDVIYLRGQLVEASEEGGVVSVNLPLEEAEKYLFGRLGIASINADELVVISGPAKEVTQVSDRLRADGVEIREIPLNVAAHSALLDPGLPAFEEKWRSIQLSAPTIPIACNLTGGWLTAENATDPTYWVRHYRNTVRYAENTALLLEDEGTVFVEVGPGRTLSAFTRANGKARPQQPVVPSMRHVDQDIDDDLFLLDMVGRLWAAGLALPDAFWAQEQRKRVQLPFYAFQHQHYFIEPGEALVGPGSGGSALQRGAEVSDWLYEPAWHEEPAPAVVRDGETSRWLVFMDRAGVGEAIVADLRRQGHEVATVIEADGFANLGNRGYALAPEAGRAGYDQTLGALIEADFIPDNVVHLWSLTTDKKVRAGSSWYHHMQERGFLSLVNLAQAMGDLVPDAEQQWTVVTNGAQAVDGTVDHPEKATLLGPVSVIPHEFSGIDISVIDVDIPQTGTQTVGARAAQVAERFLAKAQGKDATSTSEIGDLVAALSRDVSAVSGGEHIGYRKGRRYVRSFDRAHLESGPQGGRLKEGGTYLITGGLGGLAMSLADRLAKNWKANLVLVGRTAVPDRDDWEAWLAEHGPGNSTSKRIRKLLALEEAGAQVMTAAADVADIAGMETVVDAAIEHFGRVDGVLHAAGVVGENLIALKTEHDMDVVLTPKVQGAMVLDRVFAERQPDFIVYFSSTSTALGIPGQVDYAAANAFLDAYARRARRSGEPERIALAWGPWREVGLAAEAGADNIGENFEPNEHPLLDYVALDDAATVGTVELAVERMWVLDEHRSEAGRAVLPGTGHMELLISTARAAGANAVQVDNLSFMSPLAVHDGVIRDARIVMHAEGDAHRTEIQTAAHGSASGWVTHSEAHVRAIDTVDATVDVTEIVARCGASLESDDAGIRTRQEDHIIFGDRWRNLRSIRWGDGEAIAEVALRPEFTADTESWNIHPAMLDMATGYGLPLVEGYNELAEVPLYVPMTYGRLRWFAPLTPQIWSHIRLRDVSSGANLVRFDITLTDADGRVLVEIENFAIVKVADDVTFGEPDAATGALGAVGDVSSPEVMFERFLAAGLEPDEGWLAFERILESKGHPHVFVSPLPLQGQVDLIDRTLNSDDGGTKFERPDLASEYREPSDEIERGLVQLWEDLLGVDPIGVDDDFFELGGHSLIALRLFAAIKQRFGVDQPMSVLFDASTVSKLGEFIRAEVGGPITAEGDGTESDAPAGPITAGMRHVVQMSPDPGTGTKPFFLVAGMFGNILNLRHLAMLIGADRAVYGVQAKGLRDEEEPHTCFEDMATAYLEEIRRVQPEGPYFLGGFSGGGISAYEMAQQLRAVGEEVAMIVMLDTPLPGLGGGLSKADKVLMQLQRMQQMKLDYPAWYLRKKLEYRRNQQGIEAPQQATHEFRTQAIVDAFMEAVGSYTASPYDGDVHLYRPALNEEFRLTGDRYIDKHFNFQVADNGWTGHVQDLFVREVPGDHDSMVLEPNVRVLATKVVEDIAAVEAELSVD